jgi:uroporphyrinogen-III synthase
MQSSLNGKILAITRSSWDAREFRELVACEGGSAIALPTTEILPKEAKIVEEIMDLIFENRYEFCAFLSPKAVDTLYDHANGVRRTDQLTSLLNSTIVVAIGPATVARLMEHHVDVKLVPKVHSSFGLVEMFSKMENLRSKKIVIPRSQASDDFIENELSAIGMKVEVFFLYTVQTSGITATWKEFVSLLGQQKIDAIVFTSASNVRSFFEIMEKLLSDVLSMLMHVRALIAIGPLTHRELNKMGIRSFESSDHTIKGTFELAKAILKK